ncbi:MAG TPA: hypothetical protein EYP86_01700, partial [Candidatus Altiarchaeales archaeon]|nr:hypothetical protein [Candidatus Altiarchaeales archaeon]
MKSDYRVVVDRYSYDDLFLREMVKSLSLEGTYIINNPFLSTAINKILDIKHFESLGIPHPKTIVLPKLDRDDDSTDIVIEPDWDRILENIKFPCILKPYNGYAWDEVHRIETIDDLKEHYECRKYDYLLMVQELVEFIDYYRVFCINK